MDQTPAKPMASGEWWMRTPELPPPPPPTAGPDGNPPPDGEPWSIDGETL